MGANRQCITRSAPAGPSADAERPDLMTENPAERYGLTDVAVTTTAATIAERPVITAPRGSIDTTVPAAPRERRESRQNLRGRPVLGWRSPRPGRGRRNRVP
jgi:hypothetical protein